MRIVAGTARGRRLEAPPGRGTRPTSDRVREAVFSMVGSLGGVEGELVADLYAGSGALGLEALSREAAGAVFVDRDRAAVQAIGTNLEALGLDGPEVVVHQGDVAANLASVAGAGVLFADPPYAFDGWSDLLTGLSDAGFTGLAVLESDGEVPVPEGWHVLKVRRYGGTVVTLVRVMPASRPEPPDQERPRRMNGAP